MKSTSKKRTPSIVNLTVKRRYLTHREIERLMDSARKHGRYGHRDATMILVAYRHGLRASEVCDLQWQQIELSEGRLHVHRVKNGIPSVHPIRGDEMRALRKLRRDYPTDAHVFVSERGGLTGSFSASGRPPRCHSRSTHTCFAMPAGLSWPTTATTRGPCSTTSGTRTFSTPSDTPKWRPTDSRIFGGTDDGRAGSIAPHGRSSRSKKTTRHIFRSRARWRSDLAWHALPRADRGVGLQHHSVLGFGRIEQWTVPYLYRFYHPLDHFDRTACLRFKRGLDVFDHGLKLLVRQLLEQIAVLDLVLARDKQGETSQVHPRLLAAHLCDGFFSVLTEIA